VEVPQPAQPLAEAKPAEVNPVHDVEPVSYAMPAENSTPAMEAAAATKQPPNQEKPAPAGNPAEEAKPAAAASSGQRVRDDLDKRNGGQDYEGQEEEVVQQSVRCEELPASSPPPLPSRNNRAGGRHGVKGRGRGQQAKATEPAEAPQPAHPFAKATPAEEKHDDLETMCDMDDPLAMLAGMSKGTCAAEQSDFTRSGYEEQETMGDMDDPLSMLAGMSERTCAAEQSELTRSDCTANVHEEQEEALAKALATVAAHRSPNAAAAEARRAYEQRHAANYARALAVRAAARRRARDEGGMHALAAYVAEFGD